jgi:hypothetical protein
LNYRRGNGLEVLFAVFSQMGEDMREVV